MIRALLSLLTTSWRATLVLVALLVVLFVGTGPVPIVLLLMAAACSGRVRRYVGRYKPETSVVAVAFVALATGGLLSLGVLAAIAGVLLAYPPTRHWIAAQYRLVGARRSWGDACHWNGLSVEPTPSRPNGRPAPRLKAITDSPIGRRLTLELHSGWTTADVERAAQGLAAFYSARQATVDADRGNASRCDVLLHLRDPFAGASLPWPLITAERFSVWQPIPVGVDQNGQQRTVTLPGGKPHMLIGGESGSGKSVAVSVLLCAAALDPHCRLFLIDGKHVDLAAFRPLADPLDTAGANSKDALRVLQRAQREMDDRYRDLEARGLTKIPPGSGTCLVVADELQTFTTGPGSKEFNEALKDLASRGRAAGVIVLVATQKPEDRNVPTYIRDVLSSRLALRCATPEASDTILGRGWAGKGYDASTIAAGEHTAGIGYLHTEGALPALLRGYNLSEADKRCVVRTAAALRHRQTPTGQSRENGAVARNVQPPMPLTPAARGASGGNGHGHTAGGKRSPTYTTWKDMRYRCQNPKAQQWKNYGARGIRVCDRWQVFAAFLEDMGERPAGMTLDRIDPDGNYEPGNCRWATPAEQRANRRRA